VAKDAGLKQVIPQGTATYVIGNHLDDVYTNLSYDSHTLASGLTDHLGIIVDLDLTLKRKNNSRTKLLLQPT